MMVVVMRDGSASERMVCMCMCLVKVISQARTSGEHITKSKIPPGRVKMTHLSTSSSLSLSYDIWGRKGVTFNGASPPISASANNTTKHIHFYTRHDHQPSSTMIYIHTYDTYDTWYDTWYQYDGFDKDTTYKCICFHRDVLVVRCAGRLWSMVVA